VVVTQPRRQGANAVVPGGPEYEHTEILIVADTDTEPTVGFAASLLADVALIRPGAGKVLPAFCRLATTQLTISDTQRAAGLAVEQRVFRTQVQVRVVEQHANRNGPQLVARGVLAQLLVQRVQQPAVPALDLGGDGELIIFLRQSLAVLLDHPADTDAADDGWGNGEALDHGVSPVGSKNKKRHRARSRVPSMPWV